MSGASQASAQPEPTPAAGPGSVPVAGSQAGSEYASAVLSGEVLRAPRKRWMTALLGITGLLLVAAGLKLIGRFALGYRRPGELKISKGGVQVSYRSELLGKELRRVEQYWPKAGLTFISREVRFPRTGLYAGLVALSLGTFLGVGMLLDGLRVPGLSPSLLGLGLLFVVGGLVLDFVLTAFLDSNQGRCRIVVTPRDASAWAFGGVSVERADAALSRLHGDLTSPESRGPASTPPGSTPPGSTPPPAPAPANPPPVPIE